MISWCFSDNADNDLGKTVILSYFMCVSDCRTVSGTSQMLWLHFVRTEMKVRTRPCSPTLRSFTVSLTSLEQVGQTGNLTYFNVYLRKWHPIDHIDKCFFIAVFIYFFKGFDTIIAGLQWSLLYLIKFPDIQDRIHQEIGTV